MAFPVIETTAITEDNSGDSAPVTMPASIAAGNVLLVFVSHRGSAAVSQSGGSDWTIIDNGLVSDSTARGLVFGKVAAGSDSLTLTDGGADETVGCVAIRVSGHGVSNVSTDITFGTAALGTSSDPDPPNCNPGVTDDYLWCEYFAVADAATAANYESTSYTKIGQADTSHGAVCAAASRDLNASSENPGVMDINDIWPWRAQTLAIPPVSATNTGPGLRVMGG